MFRTNEGAADRALRTLAAVVLLIGYLAGAVHGWLAMVVLVAALVLALTAVVGVCPLYALLGIDTTGRDRRAGPA